MRWLLLILVLGACSLPHTPRNIQAPNDAADFWANWSSANPRVCLLIKVTSKADFGSKIIAFTSNTRDMTMPGHPGVTFKAAPGITPSTAEQGLDEASNMEFKAIYTEDTFTQAEVIAGKWKFAQIEVFSTSWQYPEYGELLHFRGHLGEFKDYQTYFTAEGRGLIGRLSQDVNMVFQRLCRAPEFGDPIFCKKNLNTTVTINSVAYNITEVVEMDGSYAQGDTYITMVGATFNGPIPPEDFYNNGKMIVSGGLNDGVSREIAYSSGVFNAGGADYINIQLKRPFPFPMVDANTNITLIAGCDHTLEMCVLYENIVNRRAEDWIPGVESVNRLPQ